MSPALKGAHLRLLAQLPSRTHEWQPTIREWGQKLSPQDEQLLRRRLLEMQSRGCTRTEMQQQLGCTNRTVRKLIGRKR